VAYLAAALANLGLTGEATTFALPDNEPLIPVLVPLRYYRDYLERIEHSTARSLSDPRAGTLAGFIPWYLRRRNPALELSQDFFDRILTGGGCLLMIDGLDEIASREQRGQVREEVENLVHDIYPGNRMIVTAREAGYRDEAVFGDDFLRLDVQAMDDTQISLLVENWCERLFPENVEGTRDELVQAICQINALRNERNLPPLISTPLMTTMVISVQWGETELPRERARLYEACVRAIIQAQYIPDDPARQQLINWGGPWEAQRDWLSELALDAFLKAVRYRGGLFEERAEFFQFVHLTFQEFLAARLLAKQRKAGSAAIKGFISDSWWREVLLLTYGYLQMDYPPEATEFIGWLSALRGSDEIRLAGAEIAGAALLEMERPDNSQRLLQANRLARLLTSSDLTVSRCWAIPGQVSALTPQDCLTSCGVLSKRTISETIPCPTMPSRAAILRSVSSQSRCLNFRCLFQTEAIPRRGSTAGRMKVGNGRRIVTARMRCMTITVAPIIPSSW